MKLILEEIEDIKVLVENEGGKKSHYITGIFLQGDIKNRNGRIYESRILNKEVARYIKEAIETSRAMGELGHPCFRPSAELLTVDGWKSIGDCVEGELVYTFNKDTQNLELNPVIRTIKYEHKGSAYHIHGRSMDTVVTGDHKFLLKDRYDKYAFFTTEEMKANQSNLAKHSIPKASNGLTRESPDTFVIPAVGGLIREKFAIKYEQPLHIDFKAFAALLGVYLAEGHSALKSRGSYQSCVCQNEGQKADEIRQILEETGLEWKERTSAGTRLVWSCYDRRLGAYLSQFGDCYSKFIDPNFIRQCDAESARIFLDAFVLGDGRGVVGAKSGRCDCFSVSERLIDDICHIATIAGIGVRKFSQITENDYEFCGRTILADNKSELFFCRFLNTKGVYLDPRFLAIDEIEYDDYVYCIEVENHTFIARDGGYTFVTGNCGPTINLDRVSHKIVSLKQEGTNWVGKAKLMDTPMGRIAKSLIDEGVKLGVSSRGMGSLTPKDGINYVNEDFYLATAADIVADPSAPDAFVSGIMEGKEWVMDGGILREVDYYGIRRRINESASNGTLGLQQQIEFARFLGRI